MKLPVYGATPSLIEVVALSSKTVSVKFGLTKGSPTPSARVTTVPEGDSRVTVRSDVGSTSTSIVRSTSNTSTVAPVTSKSTWPTRQKGRGIPVWVTWIGAAPTPPTSTSSPSRRPSQSVSMSSHASGASG